VKRNLIVIAAILFLARSDAQSHIINVPIQRVKHTVVIPENGVKISFSPKNVLSVIGVVPKRDPVGQNEIKFFFVSTSKNEFAMNFDRITLEAGTSKTLVIDKPIYDTVYSQSDGSMVLFRANSLDSLGVEFIKQERIRNIRLLINGGTVLISIANKSQKELNKMANEIW